MFLTFTCRRPSRLIASASSGGVAACAGNARTIAAASTAPRHWFDLLFRFIAAPLVWFLARSPLNTPASRSSQQQENQPVDDSPRHERQETSVLLRRQFHDRAIHD